MLSAGDVGLASGSAFMIDGRDTSTGVGLETTRCTVGGAKVLAPWQPLKVSQVKANTIHNGRNFCFTIHAIIADCFPSSSAFPMKNLSPILPPGHFQPFLLPGGFQLHVGCRSVPRPRQRAGVLMAQVQLSSIGLAQVKHPGGKDYPMPPLCYENNPSVWYV